MHFLLWAALQVGATLAYRALQKPEDPDDIPEFQGPTTSEGAKEPEVYGTVQITKPNCLWWGDRENHEVKKNVFLGPDQRLGTAYHTGFQWGICRGEIDQINRIWIGDKILQEQRSPAMGGNFDLQFTTSGDSAIAEADFGDLENGGEGVFGAQAQAYFGTASQPIDSYLNGQQTLCPAYRNLAYFVWQGGSVQIGKPYRLRTSTSTTRSSGHYGVGPSPKPIAFEVQRIDTVDGLSLSASERRIGTDDRHANPANVIYDLITSPSKMNQPTSSIDTTSFAAAATTLATEGNGLSLLIEKEQKTEKVLQDIERQINGYVFKDPADDLWKIKLAREDYTIGALEALDETNILKLREFRRTTWAGTINQVNIRFPSYDSTQKRWRKETFARLHDIGNFEIQGRYNPITLSYPGLKDPEAAADICTRELAARNRPFAAATVEVDRSLSHVNPGDVLRFSYGGNLNVSNVPMRVTKIDRGRIDGKVVLTLAEDVFGAKVGAYADTPDGGWSDPGAAAVAVPNAENLADEVPYAVARVAGGSPETLLDQLWHGAPPQGAEQFIKAFTREGSAVYENELQFDNELVYVGTLDGALAQNTPQPGATPTDDIAVDDLGYPAEIGTTATATLAQMGTNLQHLIRIGDELIFARDIENVDGTNFLLKRVYRGVLDTVRAAHADNAQVFLFTGIELGNIIHTQGGNVDVQYRPVTVSDELTESAANTKVVAMDNRGRKPHPPTDLTIEGTRYPTTAISLDSTTAQGSGEDDVGFDVTFLRRDYRIIDAITDATGDAQATNADFPSATTTEYQLTIVDDPDGTPTDLFTTTWDGSSDNDEHVITRTEILANNDGVVPSNAGDDIEVEVNTRHTFNSVVYEAAQLEQWGFDLTSALTSLDNTGARQANTASAQFTADVTDTYVFTIATDLLASGDLEVRLDSGGGFGAWTQVIASGGGTSGTIAISSGDIVEWRHTDSSGSNDTYTHLSIQQQTGTVDEAYGILIV